MMQEGEQTVKLYLIKNGQTKCNVEKTIMADMMEGESCEIILLRYGAYAKTHNHIKETYK